MIRYPRSRSAKAFTLIELLTVVAIISLLISILIPSLNRAREQAKSTHCLARLKDFANGLAAYENLYLDHLPPAEWQYPDPEDRDRNIRYGWAELLWRYNYGEDRIYVDGDCPPNFPVQRNLDPERWDNYFVCRSSRDSGPNAGHYRVYLPFWGGGQITVDEDGKYVAGPDPCGVATRTALNPMKPIIGDANERSERGDGDPPSPGQDPQESCTKDGDDCSYIDGGEANTGGSDGYNGNRFSDRHSGGVNFLFGDLHAEWERQLHIKLAVDWDLNSVADVDVQP